MPPSPPPDPRRTFSAPSISVEDTSPDDPLAALHEDEPASPARTISEGEHAHNAGHHRSTFHHHRAGRRSPGPEWNTPWAPADWKDGRVLVIDYIGRSEADGKRRIQAQEIRSVRGLRTLLANRELRESSMLRVIHIQNASWANHYILRKFNMEHDDDIVGTAFGRWARFEKPQQRAGKPVLNAKSFRPQRDPWRGISRCAFGLDYLKHYDARKYNRDPDDEKVKMMELNAYDAFETPVYGYDVFVQRLSVYVQHRDDYGGAGSGAEPEDFEMAMRNPYNQDEYNEYRRLKKQYEHHPRKDPHANGSYFPHLDELDNGNTIIIFENAQSSSPEDTLIQARHEIEAKWRRLPFYLRKEQKTSDEQLAVACMDMVLQDIFKALANSWAKLLHACETHVSILEDKIYENPADESRAPELWVNSSLWLKVEKLAYLHLDVATDVRGMMKEVTGEEGPEEWISQAPEDIEKLANSVNEDLIKPTSNLSDMMYKSVEIRDSRLGLQLDTSMWRLSWITFIFLPLTFISGFFGMNVDIFSKDENNPKLKWYFIVTVPMMVLVVLFWFIFKRSGPGLDNDPTDSQRGVYEHLFHEFSDNYPMVWSRNGPRGDFAPPAGGNLWRRLQWRLVRHWFNPEKTIKARGYNPAEDLGFWARVKRRLARRWLRELNNDSRERLAARREAELEAGGGGGSDAGSTALQQLHSGGGNSRSNFNSNNTSAYDVGPALEAGVVRGGGNAHAHSNSNVEGPLIDTSASPPSSPSPKLRPLAELAFHATQAAAEGEPGAVPGIRRLRSDSGDGKSGGKRGASPKGQHGRNGSGSGGSDGRPGSSGLGPAMVEVEASDAGDNSGAEGEGDDGQGQGQQHRRSWSRGRGTGSGMDRLHVPFQKGGMGEYVP